MSQNAYITNILYLHSFIYGIVLLASSVVDVRHSVWRGVRHEALQQRQGGQVLDLSVGVLVTGVELVVHGSSSRPRQTTPHADRRAASLLAHSVAAK